MGEVLSQAEGVMHACGEVVLIRDDDVLEGADAGVRGLCECPAWYDYPGEAA